MSKRSQRNIQMWPTICAHSSKGSGRRGDLASASRDREVFWTRGTPCNFSTFSRRLFRRDAETSMRDACATRKTPLERRACHELTRAVAKQKRADQLTLLGHSDAKLPASPAEARLETFP